MSSKNKKSAYKEEDGDVDFDFFESPRRDDSPEPRKMDNKSKNRPASPDSITPRSRRSRSGSDSYSDDSYTDTDSRSRTPSSDSSRGSRGKKNVRKIEARIPSAKTHTTKFSLSDSRDYDSDHSDSGRRAPSLEKHSSKDRYHRNGDSHTAWGPDSEGKSKRNKGNSKKGRPTTAHPSKGGRRRSPSYSGSDSNTSSSDTSTGSDVTDVSPLNSPTTHGASRYDRDFKSSGNKPPRSSSRRPISAGSSSSTNRDNLLAANKDSVDMNLLMQAILEMERTRTREGSETRTKRTIQNLMYAPPPKPRPQPKKNFSFDNEKVRVIDRENQRLMQNIIRHAQEAKKSKQKTRMMKKAEPMKASRMTTSAINRLKEQQRIEQDNKVR